MTGLSAVASNNSGYNFIGVIGYTYVTDLPVIWLMVGWITGDFLGCVNRFLVQDGEGIPTSSADFRSGTAADLSFNDVFPNVTFAQVVAKRDIGPFKYQQ